MIELKELIRAARERGATDLYIGSKVPPVLKINGEAVRLPLEPSGSSDLLELLINTFVSEERAEFEAVGDLTIGYTDAEGAPCRVHAGRQMGYPFLSVRLLPDKITPFEELPLPEAFQTAAAGQEGLLLLSGLAGSGRSSTAASFLDYVNRRRKGLVITFEHPVEVRFGHQESVIFQRDYKRDFSHLQEGIHTALKQGADVIYADGADELSAKALLDAAGSGCLVVVTGYGNSAEDGLLRFLALAGFEQSQGVEKQAGRAVLGVLFQSLAPCGQMFYSSLCRGEERFERILNKPLREGR